MNLIRKLPLTGFLMLQITKEILTQLLQIAYEFLGLPSDSQMYVNSLLLLWWCCVCEVENKEEMIQENIAQLLIIPITLDHWLLCFPAKPSPEPVCICKM